MSQLGRDRVHRSQNTGSFPKLSWDDTVKLVLDLTIKAFKAMDQDCIVQDDWEENLFSLRFVEDYLHPLSLDHEYPMQVIFRPKIHTDEMRAGKQPTKQAKEIDIMLYSSWERNRYKKHFVWEAKRIGDKRINPNYSKLNSEYIHKAIYRFIDNDYAQGLNDAGILGYVLAGNVDTIVEDINITMGNIRKNPPLPASNHLHRQIPIGDFEHVYQSLHVRIDSSQIRLHHLFFPFDFS